MMLAAQGDLQDEQIGFAREITWEYSQMVCERGGGEVATDAHGVVGCWGGFQKWPGTDWAWALFTKRSGAYSRKLTPVGRKYLNNLQTQRIELVVKRQFRNGHRLARILGFTLETENMRKFFPDGGDASLYTMVK